MSAVFVEPLPFAVVSGNQNAQALIANAGVDVPTLVWRSSTLSTVHAIIDLGAGATYDTVALVGTNLRATDTVRVRTGATNTGIGGYDSGLTAAFTGDLPRGTSAKVIRRFDARSERYVRIDIIAAGHPANFTSVQRIVVGKAIIDLGIDYGAEQGFTDQSKIETGDGWTDVTRYPVLTRWKVKLSSISDSAWRREWFPFLQSVGKSRGFLIIPMDDDPATFQSDVIFGRAISDFAGGIGAWNLRSIELNILALAQ